MYEHLAKKFPHKHFLVGIGNSLDTANDQSAPTGLRVLQRGGHLLFESVQALKITERVRKYYGEWGVYDHETVGFILS